MFTFTLITVGRLKPGPCQELMDGHLKRLTPYAKVEIRELKEEAFASTYVRERVLKEEVGRIHKAIPDGAMVVVLDADGKGMDSVAFASWLKEQAQQETQRIAFIIGGPLGLSDSIKKSAYARLSLSAMTFPHELALVMLTEQLYRAMTILAKKTYHY